MTQNSELKKRRNGRALRDSQISYKLQPTKRAHITGGEKCNDWWGI